MSHDNEKRRIIRGAPRIIIPRFKFVDVPVAIRLGIQGWFELEAVGPHYGIVRRRAAWAQHITDQGLDIMLGVNLGGSSFSRVEVGTGNDPITDATTSLTNGIAVSSNKLSETYSLNPNPPPYHCTTTRVFEFGQGTFNNDNLAEVAIGSGLGLDPINVQCGDLIRDSNGNPTSFPVAPDEILRVTHRLRIYIPGAVSDIDGGSISITGSGTHDVVIRALSTGVASAWTSASTIGLSTGASGAASATAYETDILAPITANNPSGPSKTRDSATSFSTTAGTFFRDWEVSWGLDSANNFDGGIGSIAWGLNGLNAPFTERRHFQASFNPKIDKFAGGVQRILTIQGRISLARVSS